LPILRTPRRRWEQDKRCNIACKTVKVEINNWHFGGIKKKTGQIVIWVSYVSGGWWKHSRRSILRKDGWCHYVLRII
jgi:hypothetical protein